MSPAKRCNFEDVEEVEEEVKTSLDKKKGIMARKKLTVTGRSPNLIIHKKQGNNSIQNL